MFTSDEGDGGGDVVDPSTWTIAAAQSAGGVAICFFLALVNMGEMTRLLLKELAWSATASPAVVSTAAAVETVPAFAAAVAVAAGKTAAAVVPAAVDGPAAANAVVAAAAVEKDDVLPIAALLARTHSCGVSMG